MHNIPDWLWHASDVPDWYWKGLTVWATGWVTGKAIEWTWTHREEAGEIYNNLRYKLGESSRPIIKTSSALSRISTSARAGQAQVRTATGLVGRAEGTSSATGTLSVLHKKPPTKREIYRIADTILYYFT